MRTSSSAVERRPDQGGRGCELVRDHGTFSPTIIGRFGRGEHDDFTVFG